MLKLTLSLYLLLVLPACNLKKEISVEQALSGALEQLRLLAKEAEQANRIPRTVTEDNNIKWVNKNYDWTEGFFPGSCWYLYEISGNNEWKIWAEKFQSKFEDHKYRVTNHDVGFIFNCSYGNGYRLTQNEAFKEVLITAANSLITRYNPKVGSLQSWDVTDGWQANRGWKFPVIVDNMMNLELLFKASELTGDSKYKDVAIAHANTTMTNHYRPDNSSYHVVDYDPVTGEVRSKVTAQGFSDESSWARGQAWGLYGFTMCYRFTNDEKYLEQAQKIAKYILEHNASKHSIPYWDYDAPNIPNEFKDASAAAITVSALIELNSYSEKDYLPAINQILLTLKSEEYTAKIGENNHFILKHSVGSIPHENEIDVPLNYADYYYIEALYRYQKSKNEQN